MTTLDRPPLFPTPSPTVLLRAVSLTEPWAVLVGDKLIETRSWRTAYRGPLLIHAAKGFPADARAVCGKEPFRARLLDVLGAEDGPDITAEKIACALPMGEIVTVCTLVDCIEMDDSRANPLFVESCFDISEDGPLSAEERAFGLYEVGRFAWILEDVYRLPEPIPCKGALSLWTPPLSVVERLPMRTHGSAAFTDASLSPA
jgi:hypothetical protein